MREANPFEGGIGFGGRAAQHRGREPDVLERRKIFVDARDGREEPDGVADRARIALAKELERSTAYGVGACCFHPGSAGDGDPGEACDRVGDAIRHALETVPETAAGTRVLIENTAGAGRTMGRTAEEIARMLAGETITEAARAAADDLLGVA